MSAILGRTLGCVAWLAFGCGCAAMRDGPRVPATQPGTAAYPSQREVEVGEVALVRTKPLRFVLIRCASPVVLPRKAPLECRAAANVSAQLSLSPERRSEYLVADVVSGSPAKGDRVYYVFPDRGSEGEVGVAMEMNGSSSPEAGAVGVWPGSSPGAHPGPADVEAIGSHENGLLPVEADVAEETDDAWLEDWAESIGESSSPESDPFEAPAIPAEEPRDVEWQ